MELNQNSNKEVMKGVLKEEFNRLTKLSKFYKEEIKKLPKGSILKRTISNNQYYYLKFRDESGKVKSKYLKADEILHMSKLIKERKRIARLLKQIKADINVLGKVIDKNE